jgi:SAM-dependent methyltransferase
LTKPHTSCRACLSQYLTPVLDLGKQPLANGWRTADQLDDAEPRYPLQLLRCPECGLCQLSVVVQPDLMFGPHYPYRSGYSEGWSRHCAALADEIVARTPHAKVLDIGCLDGVLLMHCEARGAHILGIDPSAPEPNHYSIPELFDSHFRWNHKFDAIVAQNVFAHVDDARGFLAGIRKNLAPGGIAILEVPWVVPLIQRRRWDTIYHEHLSYWGVAPLQRAANAEGLSLAEVRHFPEIHGGTIRCYLKAAEYLENGVWSTTWHQSVSDATDQEGTLTEDALRDFRSDVGITITKWEHYFQNQQGRVMAGFGASAKGQTFLNTMWGRPPLVGIFDDTPGKQGLYSPGWHLPVLKTDPSVIREAEVLINLAPNWPIEERVRALGFQGEIRSLWAA